MTQAMAVRPPPLMHKTAALQCDDRKVVLEADCFSFMEDSLACTRQKLTFFDKAGNKKLNEKIFSPAPKQPEDAYPIVEEKIGELMCVEAKSREKYFVASISNGGNCDECEWFEVYGMNGKSIGSTRSKKKSKLVNGIVDAAFDKTAKRVSNKNELPGFYSKNSAR